MGTICSKSNRRRSYSKIKIIIKEEKENCDFFLEFYFQVGENGNIPEIAATLCQYRGFISSLLCFASDFGFLRDRNVLTFGVSFSSFNFHPQKLKNNKKPDAIRSKR